MKQQITRRPHEFPVLWFAVIGFSLLFSAWTALFTIAARHRVAEVPVATARAGS